MKKQDVVVGELYRVSHRGKTKIVRLTQERDGKPGWDGLDIATRRPVIVTEASRVQCRCDRNAKPLEPAAKPAVAAKPGLAKKAGAKPGVAATVAAIEKGDLTKGVTVPTAKRKRPAPRATPKAKGRSGLDAAVAVLAKAGEPLGAQAIVERALKQGLWSTNGKTPAATMYAAMIREIASKGAESQFRKTGPNAFELTKAGKAAAAA